MPVGPRSGTKPLRRLVIATLRFSRPDGSPAGDFQRQASRSPRPETVLRDWMTVAEGTEAASIPAQLAGVSEARSELHSGSPGVGRRPGVSCRSCATRSKGNGDFVAVDHRGLRAVMPVRALRLGPVVAGAVVDDRGRARRDHDRRSPGRGSRSRAPRSRSGPIASGRRGSPRPIVLLGGRRLALLSGSSRLGPRRSRRS